MFPDGLKDLLRLNDIIPPDQDPGLFETELLKEIGVEGITYPDINIHVRNRKSSARLKEKNDSSRVQKMVNLIQENPHLLDKLVSQKRSGQKISAWEICRGMSVLRRFLRFLASFSTMDIVDCYHIHTQDDEAYYETEVEVFVKLVIINGRWEVILQPWGLWGSVKGADYTRIRECKICKRVFWANRKDSWTCSQPCAINNRVRRFRNLTQDQRTEKNAQRIANREYKYKQKNKGAKNGNL